MAAVLQRDLLALYDATRRGRAPELRPSCPSTTRITARGRPGGCTHASARCWPSGPEYLRDRRRRPPRCRATPGRGWSTGTGQTDKLALGGALSDPLVRAPGPIDEGLSPPCTVLFAAHVAANRTCPELSGQALARARTHARGLPAPRRERASRLARPTLDPRPGVARRRGGRRPIAQILDPEGQQRVLAGVQPPGGPRAVIRVVDGQLAQLGGLSAPRRVDRTRAGRAAARRHRPLVDDDVMHRHRQHDTIFGEREATEPQQRPRCSSKRSRASPAIVSARRASCSARVAARRSSHVHTRATKDLVCVHHELAGSPSITSMRLRSASCRASSSATARRRAGRSMTPASRALRRRCRRRSRARTAGSATSRRCSGESGTRSPGVIRGIGRYAALRVDRRRQLGQRRRCEKGLQRAFPPELGLDRRCRPGREQRVASQPKKLGARVFHRSAEELRPDRCERSLRRSGERTHCRPRVPARQRQPLDVDLAVARQRQASSTRMKVGTMKPGNERTRASRSSATSIVSPGRATT